MMSSVMPSLKYSCSHVGKGKMAIDGLSGTIGDPLAGGVVPAAPLAGPTRYACTGSGMLWTRCSLIIGVGELALYLVVYSAPDANSARLCECLQPRRHVHPVAVDSYRPQRSRPSGPPPPARNSLAGVPGG